MSKNSEWKFRRKQKFFVAQQGRCWLCGYPMNLVRGYGLTDPLAATWDHVIPKKHGGKSEQDNLMLAHKICNETRGHQLEIKSLRVADRAIAEWAQ